ncbi:hypothetical protein [Viridibacterium curvum]|uniref:Uncharacterized protein n=1 Tax=Viridibacterium curvum TaxID=1101404 RepID=A0ABP9R7Y9_9RHOO
MLKSFRLFSLALALAATPLLPQTCFAQGVPGAAIPADAKEGVLEVADGQMLLDEIPFPVTAALQVRNQDNLLVSIYSLRGKFRVKARIDVAGTLHRIWILERLQ